MKIQWPPTPYAFHNMDIYRSVDTSGKQMFILKLTILSEKSPLWYGKKSLMINYRIIKTSLVDKYPHYETYPHNGMHIPSPYPNQPFRPR